MPSFARARAGAAPQTWSERKGVAISAVPLLASVVEET